MFILKRYDHIVGKFNTLTEIEMFMRKSVKETGHMRNTCWSNIPDKWDEMNIEITEKKGKYFFKYIPSYNKTIKIYMFTAIDFEKI